MTIDAWKKKKPRFSASFIISKKSAINTNEIVMEIFYFRNRLAQQRVKKYP